MGDNSNITSGSGSSYPDDHIYELGAQMAEEEINILAVTDNYLVYEFSFIDKDKKMKKWAKRLAPLSPTVEETYETVLYMVCQERLEIGEQ